MAKSIVSKTSKPTGAKRKSWADNFFDDFAVQSAQITTKQCDELDAVFLNLGNRRARRAALAVLALSGSQLIETMTDDRDTALAFAEVQLATKGYASDLRVFADMVESASTRIKVALCFRPDMQALYDEVNAVS